MIYKCNNYFYYELRLYFNNKLLLIFITQCKGTMRREDDAMKQRRLPHFIKGFSLL